MKDLLTESFNFHKQINHQIADFMEENLDKIPEKSIDWFSHTINAQHTWNMRILELPQKYPFETHPLEVLREMIEADHQTTMEILDNEDLNRMVKWGRNNSVANAVWQVLFQVSNHYFHHRGQMMSNFRENDIEPLRLDYIFHSRVRV